MANIKELIKSIDSPDSSFEENLKTIRTMEETMDAIKAKEQQAIQDNVDLIVDAIRAIERKVSDRLVELQSIVPEKGDKGDRGRDGQNGRDGKDGKDGRDGKNGKDGQDGQDGVSVTDANIDFDGSLIITLSSGRVINVGEVVAPDLAEKIKLVTSGGGTSQQVLDTLASLQTQINTLIPSQTGNAGKYLTTDGTNTSWASVAGGLSYQGTWNASTNTPTLASGVGVNGYYYITATAGSTNLDGITDWQIGDWLMFNGTVWQKIDQSNLVTSVNGQTGAVNVGTVTSVTGTSPVASSGGNTPDISLASGYGDTQNPYASKTANFVLAAPNGTSGVPTFRAVVAADIPTLNQNTTGTAANVTGTVAIANGGTGATTLAAASIATYTGAETLTNKRINPRTSSTASTATLTPDISAFDQYNLTAQAAGLTVEAPTGTPVDGNKLIIRILDNGTPQTINWNGTYTAIGMTLPTTTTANKMIYVGCVYNSTNTRWDVIALTTQV